MSSIFADPDVKVNMSLDEIIQLSRGEKSNHIQGRNLKTTKKKKKNLRRRTEELTAEHSVPLLTSPGGLNIYVTKQSPLLSAENRRRITQSVSNRVANFNLLQKSKEIIPAEYKLVRTGQGVERVLVPASNCFLKPQRKKLVHLRKLKKTSNTLNFGVSNDWLSDTPPPLIASPIFHPSTSPEETKMEVDPDIIVIEPPKHNKNFEVIDVESDLPVELLETRKLFIPSPSSVPQSCGRTLNERFTMLIEKFQS